MFGLVLYEDGIYHVTKRRNIFHSKTGQARVKYTDGKRYNANVICVNNCRQTLEEIAESLRIGIPYICLSGITIAQERASSSHYTEDDSVLDNYIPDSDFELCQKIFKEFELDVTKTVDKPHEVISELEDIADNTELETTVFHNNDHEVLQMYVCMYCGILVKNVDHHIQIDHNIQHKAVPEPETTLKTKYSTKQHYCMFCNTLQTKLARHLERKHHNEDEVKKAIHFSSNSSSRRLHFLAIQKKGDFIYNSSETRHNVINLRRSKSQSIQTVPCPFCKGFYSKQNLRNHVRLYCEIKRKDNTNLQVLSRSIFSKVHESAYAILKEKIFPPMRDDEITKSVCHDQLVIIYANLLVTKYSTSKHHYKMIRNKIRHIGRILIQMKKINQNITDVTSIYDPLYFDTFIEAIHKLAGFNDGKFRAPSFGPTSVTLLCQLGDILQTEAIKRKDEDLEKNVQRFLKLLSTMSNSLINKVAMENRTENQRSQIVILPKTEDVKVLYNCLNKNIANTLEQLKQMFNLTLWITLCKSVLVKLMIFNRKRPGDVEKSQVVEYRNLQMVADEVKHKLGIIDRDYASSYGRYITRGKLDSPASVLVSTLDIQAIDTILSYRSNANVDEKNKYLFATPLGSTNQFYSAGKALAEFCISEKLENKNLTATKLRKHLATVTSTLEQSDQAVISDFMGHQINIHNKIYKQRLVFNDVVNIGKILNSALGIEHTPRTEQTQLNCDEIVDDIDILRLTPTTTEYDINDDECDPSYIPDLSIISEESECDENESPIEKVHTVIRSKTYPKKKMTWTTPERKTVRNMFQQYLLLENKYIPSLETVEEFKYKNQLLERRPSNQIRAWIVSEKKRMQERANNKTSGWTTPRKEFCRRYFQDYYNSGTYPKLNELQKAVDTCSELAHVSVPKLRSHLQHDYKYVMRRRSV